MSGLFGIFSLEDQEAFPPIYYGLYALQHRGQAGTGIATISKEEGALLVHRDGLISEGFGKGLITHMPGNMGMGFVKYKFRNESLPAMPYEKDGSLLAVDGFFNSPDFDIDECIEVLNGDIDGIRRYFEQLQGKYVLIFMNQERFIALKNQDGIKPLSIGRLGHATLAASESAGIESIGGTLIRELQPGELFVQMENHSASYYLTDAIQATENVDAFEFIYTARQDSIIDGVSVYEARYRMGESLWLEDQLQNVTVVGAPDSGMIAALGYAHASGLPFQEGFVRNRYIGRTFIQTAPIEREQGIQIKLTPIRRNVANRDIVLIDDSIVRGSTIKRTVKSLKTMGANSVHVRIASPPIIGDDTVTIDTPDKAELIAANHSLSEMEKMIDCDSLRYLSLDGFHRAVGRNQMYEPYFFDKY